MLNISPAYRNKIYILNQIVETNTIYAGFSSHSFQDSIPNKHFAA